MADDYTVCQLVPMTSVQRVSSSTRSFRDMLAKTFREARAVMLYKTSASR